MPRKLPVFATTKQAYILLWRHLGLHAKAIWSPIVFLAAAEFAYHKMIGDAHTLSGKLSAALASPWYLVGAALAWLAGLKFLLSFSISWRRHLLLGEVGTRDPRNLTCSWERKFDRTHFGLRRAHGSLAATGMHIRYSLVGHAGSRAGDSGHSLGDHSPGSVFHGAHPGRAATGLEAERLGDARERAPIRSGMGPRHVAYNGA